MDRIDLKTRTKQFSLRVLRLVDTLPPTTAGRALANQLVRSGMSVGANYRAAYRGKSKADFVNKLGTVEEEADESAFWMELIMDDGLLPREKVLPLFEEASQLTAIMVASRKTAKERQ